METFKAFQKEILVLIVVSTALYFNSLSGAFIMDDWPIIAENPHLTGTHNIVPFFTSGVWNNSGIPGDQDDFLYRPVFLLTFYLGHQLFGDAPVAYHALNLALHTLNAIMVFFLVLRLSSSDRRWPALFAALVFVIHPVHAESVSWIAGITDPLVTLFLLGSFLVYLDHESKPHPARLTISLLLFMLALLSKETAVMLPFILIAYALAYGKNLREARWLRNIGAFIAVLILYFIARKLALGTTIALSEFSLSGFFHLFEFTVEYFKLLIVPWPINYYYAVPADGLLQLWGGVVVLGLIGGLSALLLKGKLDNKVILFSMAWIILTLLPSLSLAFHKEPNFSIRFLYLPSVGVALMLPTLIQPLFTRYKIFAVITGVVLLLIFSSITMMANLNWQNEEIFYTHAKEVTPDHAGPVSGLAKYYQRNKQGKKAIQYYLKTVDLGDKATKVAAYENIGLIYGIQGNVAQSTTYYTKAYELAPGRSTVLVGLGNNAWSRKDFQAARSYYEQAFSADRNNYQAAYNLSLLYKMLGDLNKAAFYQQQALKIKN